MGEKSGQTNCQVQFIMRRRGEVVHSSSWKHFPAEYFTGVSHSSSVPDRGHLINPLQRHTFLIPPVSRCVFHGTHMVLPSLNRWDPGCTPRLGNSQCSSTRIPCESLQKTKECDSCIARAGSSRYAHFRNALIGKSFDSQVYSSLFSRVYVLRFNWTRAMVLLSPSDSTSSQFPTLLYGFMCPP